MIPSFTRQSIIADVQSTEAVGSGWSWINEPVGISKDDAFTRKGLLEQINTTADKSDYLWYSTRYASLLSLLLFSQDVIIAFSASCFDFFQHLNFLSKPIWQH